MQFISLLLTSTTDTTEASTTAILIQMVLPLVLLFVFMYFIMIRPQKKKEKETQQMRRDIQIGDEVVTTGGIVGIVVKRSEDTVVIETAGDRSKIRVKLWAIQTNETIHDTPDV